MASTCRTATPADAGAIVALVNDAFEIEAETLTGDRIDLADVMNRLKRGVFLVRDGEAGGLDGCVYVELRGDTGYLGLVSVASSRQSLGLRGGLRCVPVVGAQHAARTLRLVRADGVPPGPHRTVRSGQSAAHEKAPPALPLPGDGARVDYRQWRRRLALLPLLQGVVEIEQLPPQAAFPDLLLEQSSEVVP